MEILSVYHMLTFQVWLSQLVPTFAILPGKLDDSKNDKRDFPSGPVVKTPHFHFRGRRFDP